MSDQSTLLNLVDKVAHNMRAHSLALEFTREQAAERATLPTIENRLEHFIESYKTALAQTHLATELQKNESEEQQKTNLFRALAEYQTG